MCVRLYEDVRLSVWRSCPLAVWCCHGSPLEARQLEPRGQVIHTGANVLTLTTSEHFGFSGVHLLYKAKK